MLDKSVTETYVKDFQGNAWGKRHSLAWRAPTSTEAPIVAMYEALAQYADHHFVRFESKVGEDGVLGPAWLNIAKAVRVLLNGETGRLDCGTLDGLLFDMVEAAGFDKDEL